MLKVESLGGVRTVTGSATLLEKGSLRWLVDCGTFQGDKELEKLSVLFQKLEKNYKRLRGKLKRGKTGVKEFQDPRWLRQLEEVNKKLERLGSELD